MLFLGSLLSACSSTFNLSVPPEKIRNPDCSYFSDERFEILQTLSYRGGALANVCEYKYGMSCWHGMVVFLEKPDNVTFYDEQMININSDKCLMIDGVYEYTTTEKVLKTVPKLKLIEGYLANPEYAEWQEKYRNEKEKHNEGA